MLRTSILVVSFLFCSLLCAQEGEYTRIAFYNLENLFDTEDDSLIRDEEYLPDGMRNWNYFRYTEKSNRMAKAIVSIGGWKPVDVVGVCEVENRKVLEDLVNSAPLKRLNYKIIHFQSPDRRGIDVGMLYRPQTIDTLFAKPIPVLNPEDPEFKTRDILYVKFVVRKKDTLHYFVNHWPSRYGGQMRSEPKRVLAAKILRQSIDSILRFNSKAKIVVMGDLNDSPNNISVTETLQAVQHPEKPGELKNLMRDLPVNAGSHRYQGEWNYLDQIIVSQGLYYAKQGLQIKNNTAHIHKESFLLESDEKYPGTKPFRSFIGMRYNHGFSDHLPVYIDLILKETPNAFN